MRVCWGISWPFPHTPIRLTGNGPLPHTSSARNWFIGVMARAHSGTRAADINSRRKRWTTSYFFTNSRRKRWTGCCGSWPSRQPGEGICSDAASWDRRVLYDVSNQTITAGRDILQLVSAGDNCDPAPCHTPPPLREFFDLMYFCSKRGHNPFP